MVCMLATMFACKIDSQPSEGDPSANADAMSRSVAIRKMFGALGPRICTSRRSAVKQSAGDRANATYSRPTPDVVAQVRLAAESLKVPRKIVPAISVGSLTAGFPAGGEGWCLPNANCSRQAATRPYLRQEGTGGRLFLPRIASSPNAPNVESQASLQVGQEMNQMQCLPFDLFAGNELPQLPARRICLATAEFTVGR